MLTSPPRQALAATILALCLAAAGCSKAPQSARPERPLGKGSATLTWTPPAESQEKGKSSRIVGYRIYLGSSPEALRPEALIDDPDATRYVVRQLPAGTHYFSVRSYDADGVESDATSIVSKTIR